MQDGVVQVMVSVKKTKVLTAIMFTEFGLAVDAAVVVAKEAVNKSFVLGRNAFEGMFLDIAKLRNHVLIDFKVCGSILAWIAERFAPKSAEGEQSGHVKRRIHENAQMAS